MTVYAGDLAIYRPRGAKPVRVQVTGHTAKRVVIVVPVVVNGSTCDYLVRWVKAERLERLGGGVAER